MVEHLLPKQRVAGSNPVSRSRAPTTSLIHEVSGVSPGAADVRPIVGHLLSEQGGWATDIPAITAHDAGPPQAGVPVRGTRTSCRPKPRQAPAVARADSDHPRQMGSFRESSGNTQADRGSGRAEAVRAQRTGEHSVRWGDREAAPGRLALRGVAAYRQMVSGERRTTTCGTGLRARRGRCPRCPVLPEAESEVAEGRAARRDGAGGLAFDDAPAEMHRDAGEIGCDASEQVER